MKLHGERIAPTIRLAVSTVERCGVVEVIGGPASGKSTFAHCVATQGCRDRAVLWLDADGTSLPSESPATTHVCRLAPSAAGEAFVLLAHAAATGAFGVAVIDTLDACPSLDVAGHDSFVDQGLRSLPPLRHAFRLGIVLVRARSQLWPDGASARWVDFRVELSQDVCTGTRRRITKCRPFPRPCV